MRCLLLVCIALLAAFNGFSQINSSRLEVIASPGLFLEQMNSDGLLPDNNKNESRLGDVVSYDLLYNFPLKNERWRIKAGAGFSQRHYSLTKYSFGDYFAAIIFFWDYYPSDTFALNYVRLTNNYFQLPVSIGYNFTRNRNMRFKLSAGLNFRSDFLLSSKAEVRFDSSYFIPQASDIPVVKSKYTAHAAKYVLSIEPYIENDFAVYKNLGLFLQFRPFSIYTSRLDHQFSSSTVDLFGFSFGAYYAVGKR